MSRTPTQFADALALAVNRRVAATTDAAGLTSELESLFVGENLTIDQLGLRVNELVTTAKARLRFGPVSTLTAAATVDLGAAGSHLISIGGTATSISSFGTSASTDNPIYEVVMASACTLVHSSTLLIPGSANITAAVGDTFTVQWTGSAWDIWDYNRTNGSPINGVIRTGDTMTGALLHTLGTVSAPGISFSGDANTGLWSPAADTLALSVGGVEALRVTSTGSVGIGTTSPGAKLEVSGLKNTSVLRLSSTTGDTGWTDSDFVGKIEFYSADGSDGGPKVTSFIQATNRIGYAFTGGQELAFGVSGSGAATEAMRINNLGYVGIGTTSPSYKLDVSKCDTSGSRTSPVNVLAITSDSDSPGPPYTGFGAGLLFKSKNYTLEITDAARIRSVLNDSSIESFGSGLSFDVTATRGGSLTQAMYIHYNGYVGINNSDPQVLLDVADDSIRIRTSASPSGGSSGYAGEISWDGTNLYVCTATNTWKKLVLQTI